MRETQSCWRKQVILKQGLEAAFSKTIKIYDTSVTMTISKDVWRRMSQVPRIMNPYTARMGCLDSRYGRLTLIIFWLELRMTLNTMVIPAPGTDPRPVSDFHLPAGQTMDCRC